MTLYEIFKVFYLTNSAMKNLKKVTVDNYIVINRFFNRHPPEKLEKTPLNELYMLIHSWDELKKTQDDLIYQSKRNINSFRDNINITKYFVPDIFYFKVTNTLKFLDECEKEMTLFKKFIDEKDASFYKNTAQFRKNTTDFSEKSKFTF